ncbi:MAG: hypothetical protein AB7P40_23375 [Chloroflexota bacterium]
MRALVEEQASLLERISQAFAAGDEVGGYDLIAEAIERLEMPSEVVARALCAGLEAWRPAPMVGNGHTTGLA